MLISCKCLNFVATVSGPAPIGADVSTVPQPDNPINSLLMQSFLHKYNRNFIFYTQCMEFLKQAIGPIPDITINAVNQRDLIYSLTLEIVQEECQQWQISVCINCNVALCAKKLRSGGELAVPPNMLVNCALLTNNEEMASRRSHSSFSETFGILVMDQPTFANKQREGMVALQNFSVGSLSAACNLTMSPAQTRMRQLQQNLQQRLQREITDTDERIQRYKETQFALLKSFREKSEQEFEVLAKLLQAVPEEQVLDMLDNQPPALDVTGGAVVAARRRNTIGSRREINSTASNIPSTPTTPTIGALPSFNLQQTTNMSLVAAAANISAIDTQHMQANSHANNSSIRRLSNFDTPPATPEATAMSVESNGNSPTFQPQQQQPQRTRPELNILPQQIGKLNSTTSPSAACAFNNFQQQFPTPTVEEADDCLFELEGIDSAYGGGNSMPTSKINNGRSSLGSSVRQVFATSLVAGGQRSVGSMHYKHLEHNPNDIDENDGVEEAEELDLDTSLPIPVRAVNPTAAQLNFAKSLPIEIANSPLAERVIIAPHPEEDELENTVDIAASIKALAKSVHGEAVFGDLPRPRLRSQI